MSRPPPACPDLPGSRGAAWVVAQSLVMLAVVAAGPAFPGDWHSPWGLAAGGLLLGASGFLGISGVVHLGRNRTPFPQPRPGSRLVEHGVYAWIRHPLYTSVMSAGLGWALLWQSLPTLVLALLQVPFFTAKALAEEDRLRAAFPGYAAYAARVKRFVPGLF